MKSLTQNTSGPERVLRGALLFEGYGSCGFLVHCWMMIGLSKAEEHSGRTEVLGRPNHLVWRVP